MMKILFHPHVQEKFERVKRSRIFNNLLKIYSLDKKKVLDIGCSDGEYLIHFGKGSKGIEVVPEHIENCQKAGLEVINANVEDDLSLNETFDVIWCNNLIEHLVAPHLFLMRIRRFLKEDSMLILGCPVIPKIFLFRYLKRFEGYLAQEHLNFFTSLTLRLTLERAGYLIEEARLFYFRNSFLDKLLSIIAPHIYLICRKVKDFQYPSKRLEIFTPKFQKQ